MEIANGNFSWQPNKTLKQFEQDLEFLPLLFAQENDIVVVHNEPTAIFQHWLKKMGIPKVQFLNKKNILGEKTAQDHAPYKLIPWGWSPAMHHKLQHFKAGTSREFKISPSANWEKWHKNHYSRATSVKILKKIISKYNNEHLLPAKYHPITTKHVDEVKNSFNYWPQIVLKSPWSSSGRGVQMLRYGELNESNIQWINSILKQQDYIMVEPLLDKKVDFSLHFHISPQSIQYLGFGKFHTNKNGQYQDNIIRPAKKEIPSHVSLEKLAGYLKRSFELLNVQTRYEGYAGVDLMLVNIENKTYVHPCVEVNWRFNMGLIALQVEKFIHPDARGKFSIFFEPHNKFKSFHEEMIRKYPVKFKNDLPFKGYFPLSDPEKSKSGAYLHLI